MEVLWGFIVGLVFSTVGAAGAILAGVGHISLFGIKEANLIKFYNQLLVAVSPIVSLPLYFKQKRVVWLLAILLAVGSIIGSSLGAYFSYLYLKDLKQYKNLFGLLTFLIGIKVIYDAFSFKKDKSTCRNISTAFKGLKLSIRQCDLLRDISLFNPVLVGFVIAFLSSAMGVGGGFLIVPYMLLMVRLLAYYVPGTAVLVVFITTLVGMLSYYKLGIKVEWIFILKESLGVILGSLLGPNLSKVVGEKPLRIFIGLLLLALGLSYLLNLL